MKLRWMIVIAVAVCFFILRAVNFSVVYQPQEFQPPPDRTSAFLKNYTPRPVIESFMSNEDGFGMGELKGGWSASRGNFNERELQPQFAIEAANQYLLMTAVKNDIDTQLANYGAVVLTQQGDLENGFTFTYKLGTTTGRVDLSPLGESPDSHLQRNTPLPDGIFDVMFTVKIAENPGA